MKIYVHNKQLNTHKLSNSPWKTENIFASSISFVPAYGNHIDWTKCMVTGIESEKDRHCTEQVLNVYRYMHEIQLGVVQSTSTAYLFDRDTYVTKKNFI